MSIQFNGQISSAIEKAILNEEEKYQAAFKEDANFQVLKDIRKKIKQLKQELSDQCMQTKNGQ